MAKTVDKYLGKAESYAKDNKILVHLKHIDNSSERVEKIDAKFLSEFGITINDPYFELTEITEYSLVPKEFGGMETHIDKTRQYVKISWISQEIKRRKAQIELLNKQIVDLQDQCKHDFVVLDTWSDDDGWSVNVYITWYKQKQCKNCGFRQTDKSIKCMLTYG